MQQKKKIEIRRIAKIEKNKSKQMKYNLNQSTAMESPIMCSYESAPLPSLQSLRSLYLFKTEAEAELDTEVSMKSETSDALMSAVTEITKNSAANRDDVFHSKTIIISNSHIKKVAYGDKHMLIQTENGNLFCKGDMSEGKTNIPMWKIDDGAQVVDIACGDNHSAMLLNNGKVICWGSNKNWQCDVPTCINIGKYQIQKIVCGPTYTCGISSEGRVFVWGKRTFLLPGLENHIANDIAVSDNYAAVLTAEGKIISWIVYLGVNSDNVYKHLRESVETPKKYESEIFAQIGFYGNTVVALTIQGKLLYWGGSVDNIRELYTDLAEDIVFSSISCGRFAVAAIDINGKFYMFGKNAANNGLTDIPEVVHSHEIEHIFCGWTNCTVISKDDTAIGWGTARIIIGNHPCAFVSNIVDSSDCRA